MFAFCNHILLFKDLFFTFLFGSKPPMDGLSRFGAGGDYQLGRQEPFLTSKSIISFMVELNSVGNTIVQAKGYDVVEDPGITGGLVF